MGRLGRTGETYVFDHSGRLLTDSRFDEPLRHAGLLQAEDGPIYTEVRDLGGDTGRGFVPALPRSHKPLTRMAKSALSDSTGLDVDGYAERFVRTVKENCVDQMIFFGEESLRNGIREFSAHYQGEIIKAWKIGLSLQSNGSPQKQELSDDDNGSAACSNYYYRDAA